MVAAMVRGGAAGARIDRVLVEALAAKVTGSVILPGEAGYDETRKAIWNAAIDRYPAVIAPRIG